MPPTPPQNLAWSESSVPSLRLGCISFPTSPAKPGRFAASTAPPDLRAFFRILDSVSEKTPLTSWMFPSRSSLVIPLSDRASRISSSLSCLRASNLTSSASISSCWKPLISITAPPLMETLTSCLIDPRPRFTLPVDLSNRPMARAASWASSGVWMSGAVATSTRGMPSLSSLYILMLFLSSSEIFRAASSSRHMVWIPISLSPTRTFPPVAMMQVRWKPVVLLPSITIFRIGCISSTGVELRKFAIIRPTSIDSSFRLWGGSSSASTRHVVSL